MKTLYILRHGIAVDPGTPGIADDDRPLTNKGEKRIGQIAIGLRRLDLQIDRILSSPLPRAHSTAKIVARILNLEKSLEMSDLLRPGTDLASIEAMLASRSEENVMIVGHNPSLSQLLSKLVLGDTKASICELKKGGVAALTSHPLPGARYELSWLAAPRLFRRLQSVVDF